MSNVVGLWRLTLPQSLLLVAHMDLQVRRSGVFRSILLIALNRLRSQADWILSIADKYPVATISKLSTKLKYLDAYELVGRSKLEVEGIFSDVYDFPLRIKQINNWWNDSLLASLENY